MAKMTRDVSRAPFTPKLQASLIHRKQNPTEYPHHYFMDFSRPTLGSDLTCRIIHLENIAESGEKALEEWVYCRNPSKAPFERMEHVSRPVIYGVDLDNDNPSGAPVKASGTMKLLLRDPNDNYFYGVELEKLQFLHPIHSSTGTPLAIPLGGKLKLKRGAQVAHGVVFLTKSTCEYLGDDADSPLSRQLNEGIVAKYIDLLERRLGKSVGTE